MRETLYDLRQRFRNQRLGPQIFKLYVLILLQGLNYLHAECRLIQTGKFKDRYIRRYSSYLTSPSRS